MNKRNNLLIFAGIFLFIIMFSNISYALEIVEGTVPLCVIKSIEEPFFPEKINCYTEDNYWFLEFDIVKGNSTKRPTKSVKTGTSWFDDIYSLKIDGVEKAQEKSIANIYTFDTYKTKNYHLVYKLPQKPTEVMFGTGSTIIVINQTDALSVGVTDEGDRFNYSSDTGGGTGVGSISSAILNETLTTNFLYNTNPTFMGLYQGSPYGAKWIVNYYGVNLDNDNSMRQYESNDVRFCTNTTDTVNTSFQNVGCHYVGEEFDIYKNTRGFTQGSPYMFISQLDPVYWDDIKCTGNAAVSVPVTAAVLDLDLGYCALRNDENEWAICFAWNERGNAADNVRNGVTAGIEGMIAIGISTWDIPQVSPNNSTLHFWAYKLDYGEAGDAIYMKGCSLRYNNSITDPMVGTCHAGNGTCSFECPVGRSNGCGNDYQEFSVDIFVGDNVTNFYNATNSSEIGNVTWSMNDTGNGVNLIIHITHGTGIKAGEQLILYYNDLPVADKISANATVWLNSSNNDRTITYPASNNGTGTLNLTDGGLSTELTRNGTAVSNPEITILGAGSWEYIFTVTGNDTVHGETDTKILNVQKAADNSSIFQNVTTLTYPETIKLGCGASRFGLTVNMLINGTIYLNETEGNLWAGNYNLTCASDGNENISDFKIESSFLINRGAGLTSLTSSNGWVIYEGESSIISCSFDQTEGTTELQINNITRTSPYSASYQLGTHTANCFVYGVENYTATNESNTLIANSLISCTDHLTYVFSKNITTTQNITTLNFTSVHASGFVKDDLSDVYVPNATNVSINLTNGYYVIVNNTNFTTFPIYFGNYYINLSTAGHKYHNVTTGPVNVELYTQINKGITYTIMDELTGIEMFPPNATLTSIIHCSQGETYIPISENDTKFLLASSYYTDKASLRIAYSADAYYSRQLYPSEQDSLYLSFYVVDAYVNALDRIDFKMLDSTNYNSKLQVYKTIQNLSMIITEGYFDVARYFSAYLMEDTDYYLRTINPDSSTTEYGRITVVAPNIRELGQASMQLNPESVLIANDITMNAWTNSNRTVLYILYADARNETIQINITTQFQNGTIFQNESYDNTDHVSLTYNITDWSNETFTILFSLNHETFGNSPVTYMMSVMPAFLWSLGVSSWMYAWISLGIITLVGGLATRKTIVAGSSLLIATILILRGIGWMTMMSDVALVFIIVLLILGIIIYFKQGGE